MIVQLQGMQGFEQGVQTLFIDLNNTTHTYKNGLINGEEFICFDVTDEVE